MVILKHAGTPGHDAGTADAGAGEDYVLITGHRDTPGHSVGLCLLCLGDCPIVQVICNSR